MLHQICSTKNPFDLRCESVTCVIVSYDFVLYSMIINFVAWYQIFVNFVKSLILSMIIHEVIYMMFKV